MNKKDTLGRFISDLTEEERFWLYVKKTRGCWKWVGGKNQYGYGIFWSAPHTISAHRFSYELHKGKIPKGLILDHLCRNPECTNPEHLEIVSYRENNMRGFSIPSLNFKKTHCQNGHLLEGKNLVKRSDTRRDCIICRRIRFNKWARDNPDKMKKYRLRRKLKKQTIGVANNV